MRIQIELNQTWGTAKELLEYLHLLSRTLERIAEMEVDCPTDWYLEIKNRNDSLEHDIFLTHL